MADGPALNQEGPVEAHGDPVALSRSLVAAAKAMGADVTDDVRALSASLRAVDPLALSGDSARVAFWINVYNSLMRHAVVAWKMHAGERVAVSTYNKAVYLVGSSRWSLHAIEHGVLRRNRPAPYTFWAPLSKGDPRLGALPSAFDPRVHFALNCAAASCPPVRAYAAERLDAQLDTATRAYLAGEFALDRGAMSARIPYLCDLYSRDFGRARAALAWVSRHLDEPDRAWVTEHLPRVKVTYGGYRWEIVR